MSTVITRTLVPEDQRMDFLPDKVGVPTCIIFEQFLYATSERLSADYDGGYWQFYELDNRGWYMAPGSGEFGIAVDGNGYEGVLSADAFGIVVTLLAMNGALMHGMLPERYQRYITNAYYGLKDYAHEHKEAVEILAAID